MTVQINKVSPATGVVEVRELAWKTANSARNQCISLGKALQTLKAETLAGGKSKSAWYELFNEDSKRRPLPNVSEDVSWPFGSDKADKLIRVAERFGEFENNVLEKLPDSWGTLHALALVPKECFDSALEKREICPGMTRSKANALKPRTATPASTKKNMARAFLKSATKEDALEVAIEVLRNAGCSLQEVMDAWKKVEKEHLAIAA